MMFCGAQTVGHPRGVQAHPIRAANLSAPSMDLLGDEDLLSHQERDQDVTANNRLTVRECIGGFEISVKGRVCFPIDCTGHGCTSSDIAGRCERDASVLKQFGDFLPQFKPCQVESPN